MLRSTPSAMLLSLLLIAGCNWGSGTDPGPDSGSGTDADPDDYPGCHWDCLDEGQICEEGKVRVWYRQAVPCSEWTGECPSSIEYECEKGCRSDLTSIDDAEIPPEVLCEEQRPKQIGDACASDTDCEPFTVLYSEEGISVLHLSCDLDAGQCVEIMPPQVEGIGDSCQLTPSDVAELYGNLVLVDAPACATGLCAVDAYDDATCLPQGCTIRCTTDRDCPQGTLCVEASESGLGVNAACVKAFIADDLSRWDRLECPEGEIQKL